MPPDAGALVAPARPVRPPTRPPGRRARGCRAPRVGSTAGAADEHDRSRGRRTGRWLAALAAGATVAGLVSAPVATAAPVGAGFTITPSDLAFILRQITIAEHHAATWTPQNPCGTLVGPGPDQIPDRLTSYGLRTVDGSCNNLFAGRETFAAADQVFPRAVPAAFQDADPATAPFGGGQATSYAQTSGVSSNADPRLISNWSTTRPRPTRPRWPLRRSRSAARTTRHPRLHHRPRPVDRQGGCRRTACPRTRPVHPQRHHRRRAVPAVQLGVHLLRPVLRPRRGPDGQGRWRGLRAAARPTTRSSRARTTCWATGTTCRRPSGSWC